MNCPACEKTIPFPRILFTVNPIFLRCPHCRARLRGDRTMMAIGALVAVLAAAIAVAGFFAIHAWVPPRHRWWVLAAFVIALSSGMGIPMTRVIMRRGRYLLRDRPPGP